MSNYTLTMTVDRPYSEAVGAVRTALERHGFGVLTEVDLAAALKDKLGVDVEDQVILGACRPPLAYAAIQADPSIAAVLPCNVVVRALDRGTTLVEALDPEAMMSLAGSDALTKVAEEPRPDSSQPLPASPLTADAEPNTPAGTRAPALGRRQS